MMTKIAIANNKENVLAEHQLSILTKICFAIGGMPYTMCANALGFFISPFILEIAKLRPIDVSIIVFTANGWDAITDPLVGYAVSKTKTRFGKYRPWILFSTPFSIVCYMMIWYVPNFSNELKTAWYVIFYCLFQTFLSCIHVPYTSLTMVLTPNQMERDSATGYRMICEVIGVLLSVGIPAVFISTSSDATCEILLSNQTNVTISNNLKNENINSELGKAYLLSGGVMSLIYLICACSTFFGTKELPGVIEDTDKDFFKPMKKVFTHKSYITLLLAYLFSYLSISTVQANIALYAIHAIDARDIYQYVLVTLLVSSVLFIPLWIYLQKKIGKKLSYGLGLFTNIPCLIALYFIQKSGWYVFLIAVLFGMGVSVNYLLPWSMLPDVIDDFMIKTGTRRESIFYSFYVFFTKISTGIAIAVTSAILDSSGYIECSDNCCSQPDSVGETLRLLIVPLPIILLMLAILFIWLHPIDELKRASNKKSLDEIRQSKNSMSLEYTQSPSNGIGWDSNKSEMNSFEKF